MDLRSCRSAPVLSIALALAGCAGADADAEPDASEPDPACFPTVTFADPLLEAQLREERPGDWEEMFDGSVFKVCDSRHGCGNFYGIRDFDGLQCLPEIKVVNCVACPVKDLRPLRHVKWLSLSGADVRDLDDLRDFDDLRELTIHNGMLENVDALFAGDAVFSSLESISLTGNRIAAIAGTPDLPKLGRLDLCDNELSQLPPAIPSVEFLLLKGNELSEVPSAADWPALENLVLSDNRIVDITPLAEHTEYTGLRRIELAGNWITDVSALSGHPLGFLDLSRNLLVSLGDLSLPEAGTLILDDNPLVDVSGLVAPGLKELAASNGALVHVPPASALPSKELYLAGNQIRDLAPLAALGDDIWHLDLSRNPIDLTTLPPGLEAFYLTLDAAGLTSLAGIEGSRSNYLSLADNALSDLSPLAAIDTSLGSPSVELAGNPISTLAPLDGTSWDHLGLARTGFKALEELLGPASAVRSLDLRSNGITDASALAAGPLQLIDVDLSDNLLTSMPTLLPADEGLNGLDLSDNPIADLGPLPHTLRKFACRHCALSSLAGLTSPKSELHSLDLTGNPIESLTDIAELSELDTLILDEVGDLDLTPLALREDVLEELSMQRCGLHDAVQLLPLALRLDLRDNELRELPPEDPLDDHQSIDLTGNPIDASPKALVTQCRTRYLSLSPFSCYYSDPGV